MEINSEYFYERFIIKKKSPARHIRNDNRAAIAIAC